MTDRTPQEASLRDALAAAIYADNDEPEWLSTVDGSPNTASYEFADRALAVIRPRLGAVWSAYLGLLLDAKLEDGTPVLDTVFALDPDLRLRFADVFASRARGSREGARR